MDRDGQQRIHFRNHGFILSNDGWELSPLYDVNPDIYGEYLSLNVDEYDSGIDFDLAIESAPYYGLKKNQAKKEIDMIKSVVRNNWRELAKKKWHQPWRNRKDGTSVSYM